MKTFIYMVRHGDSPKDGNERTRELTEKGRLDAQRITDILQKEDIDTVISSPYSRSIQTVQKVAEQIKKEVIVFEDLKEQIFIAGDKRISDKELFPFLAKAFSNPTYALKGGESIAACQQRAIKVLKEILNTYQGQKVVIGTHGAVMTLMMGFYDSRYDLNFLLQTTKPDIYRMEFDGQDLVDVIRLWEI